jgi:hypothetical protein
MPWVRKDRAGRQRNYRTQTQPAAELAAELALELELELAFGDHRAGIALYAY